jgi:hypothetical protein
METPNQEPAVSQPPTTAADAVWIRIPSAARLVDMSPAALKMRLSRVTPPAGVIQRWGRSVLIHREKFLEWVSGGANANA